MSNDMRSRAASASEVQQLRRDIINSAPREGDLARHYQDVKHLKPEVAGIDCLSFAAEVSQTGVVTQPSNNSLPKGYYAELFGIKGYMEDPNTDPELAPKIEFNIKDVERSGDIFSTNIEMAHLVNVGTGGGRSDGLYWDRGLYVFDPGARVKVTFTLDGDGTSGYAALASGRKEWGVLLLFNLYAI